MRPGRSKTLEDYGMSRAEFSVQISVPWRQGRRQEEEVSLGEQGEEQEPQGQEEQEQG